MKKIFFEPTEKTPLVILDSEREKYEIIGVSIPDNGTEFYKPILNWFEAYTSHPNKKTELVINLDYFNISSSKMILFIFYKLMELRDKNADVKITWFYNDEEILEAGTDYQYITRLDFNFTKASRLKMAPENEP